CFRSVANSVTIYCIATRNSEAPPGAPYHVGAAGDTKPLDRGSGPIPAPGAWRGVDPASGERRVDVRAAAAHAVAVRSEPALGAELPAVAPGGQRVVRQIGAVGAGMGAAASPGGRAPPPGAGSGPG